MIARTTWSIPMTIPALRDHFGAFKIPLPTQKEHGDARKSCWGTFWTTVMLEKVAEELSGPRACSAKVAVELSGPRACSLKDGEVLSGTTVMLPKRWWGAFRDHRRA